MEKLDVQIKKYSVGYANDVCELAISAWSSIYAEYLKQLGKEIYSNVFNDWKKQKERNVLNKMHYQNAYVATVNDILIGFIS